MARSRELSRPILFLTLLCTSLACQDGSSTASLEPSPSDETLEPLNPIADASAESPSDTLDSPEDITEAEPDVVEPEPDSTEPESDGVEPEPDATEPEPDSSEPEPDSTEPEPDGVEPEPDTTEPDVSEPEPEPLDPGRVTLHRLNVVEYDNTVQDLLGTTQEPAINFPADDQGYGFDNIADVLSISPLHFELYELAARGLIEEALHVEQLEPETWFFEAEEQEELATVGGPSAQSWNLWSVGSVSGIVEAPGDGTYRIRARAWSTPAGDEPAEASLLVDGIPVYTEYVESPITDPEILEIETFISEGTHEVGVSFNNDFWLPDEGLDRNLYVDWFDVEGPLELYDVEITNPIREALVTCEPGAQEEVEDSPETDEEGEPEPAEEEEPEEPAPFDPEACVQEILEGFVPRAWRRPIETPEYESLVGLYSLAVEDGAGFDEALSVPLIASLLSPHFLFRVELDPEPTDLTPHLLNDYELASRLSYFLWSTMPDEQLFEAAANGTLQDPMVLMAETTRMLEDPRSAALVDNFAGQWLYLRGLWDAAPDPWVFPEWNEDLRASMASEAWLFVHSFITQERPMSELLTSSTSFVDQTLADYYGMDDLELAPGEFAEVDVTTVERGGFLRQAGILTTLSYPKRTSPVKRGKWVLGQLLCMEPPPPPPGVEGLIEEETEEPTTLAEKLAQHTADPSCAGCHMLMDPIGLGMENFDGIGRFRIEDNGFPIDPSGTLPDGTNFAGATELIEHLAANPNLSHCIVEKTLTYALGRGPEGSDEPYMDAIAAQFEAGGMTFKELILAIVTSEPFRMRRGEAEPEPETDETGEEN